MIYLLDTHAFLWLRQGDVRLTDAVRELYADGANDFLLSIASVWEMAIKASIGKLTFPSPLRDIIREAGVAQGIGLLPVALDHVLRVEHLPFHHRDPFDRCLAAQALEEGLPVVSRDTAFDAYGVKRAW